MKVKVVWLKLTVLFIVGLMFVMLYASHSMAAPFREYPIGDAIEKNKLEIAAVWFPGVQMEMPVMPNMYDLKKNKNGEVIHFEADIHATKGNANGFGAGEWIPFLSISYTIEGSGKMISGQLLPMVAKDGPHYGAQIFLPYGNYKFTYHITAPDSKDLARHSDRITGVTKWWKPFSVSWDLNFKGAKK